MNINKVEKNYVITVEARELDYILRGLCKYEMLILLSDSPRNKRRISVRNMIEQIKDLCGTKKIFVEPRKKKHDQ
jgi:hypothetical protein